MRRLILAGILCALAVTCASGARANCAVIDQLDKLHTIQMRLANTPDTGLFVSDIRQLRAIIGSLSNREALNAVDGNAIVGRGAQVVRFLTNTQSLLAGISLDEPNRVRSHFSTSVRRNMDQVRGHLTDLRCTREQIAIARSATTQDEAAGNSDAEDLAEVMETLARVRQEVTNPRNVFLGMLLLGLGMLVAPFIKRWLILRKRRIKRHNTNYATQYRDRSLTEAGNLLDINCFGTKLARAHDHMLAEGDIVEVAVDDDWVKGTVVWSNTHYSGILFRKSISLTDVAYVIAKSEKA